MGELCPPVPAPLAAHGSHLPDCYLLAVTPVLWLLVVLAVLRPRSLGGGSMVRGVITSTKKWDLGGGLEKDAAHSVSISSRGDAKGRALKTSRDPQV